MIEKMLERYEIQNDDDLLNALKEIFQEIALLGLYRGGFFEKAVFYGGMGKCTLCFLGNGKIVSRAEIGMILSGMLKTISHWI